MPAPKYHSLKPAQKKPSRRFKTVKAQIEAMPQIAELEAHWFKNPREEMREAMVWRKAEEVMPDYSKSGAFSVHSHPKYRKPSLPSFADLISLNSMSARAMAVAAMTPEGKLAGYTMIAKSGGLSREAAKVILSAEKPAHDKCLEKIKAIRKEIAELKKGPQSEQVINRAIRLYAAWRTLGDEATARITYAMKSTGWRIRFAPMPGFVFSNGYYIPKPKPQPPKGGAAVSISEAEREKAKKKAEEERRRRLNLLQQQRNKGRLRS